VPTWSPVRYARNGDVSIAYKVAGSGDVDLLIVGGFVGHLEIVNEVPLAERFWDRLCSFARVILFDKRGMGLSDRNAGGYTIENVTDDALAVLDAVGVERAAVLGISEGGAAATMLAAAHPDRVSAMVQWGTCARIARSADYPQGIPFDDVRDWWDNVISTWGDGASFDHWAPSVAGDPELRHWWGRLLRNGASPSTAREIILAYEHLDVRPLLPAVQVPTLVAYRTGDRLVPARLSQVVADWIPGARVLALPGPDHLWIVDHDAFVDAMEEFLTGRPAAVRGDRVLATVLFTDVVGSTERAAELGDRSWHGLLERHERRCRVEVERHRGRVVKTTGDGLLATFDGPGRAVRAALAMRDSAAALGLELRAGAHTGECEIFGDDDIAGMAVNIAARIEAAAGAGEVAVSGTVKDLVVGSGLEFADRGTHALKGVPGEWRLYAVTGDAETRPAPAAAQALQA
jgi:class 3 adenylate cyclase/pimeloyl-ACP methyl ester carboxylesterase